MKSSPEPSETPSTPDPLSERRLGEEQLQLELQRARAAAEASERAKNEFLAVVSHEIRTPMAGIIGFGNLLRDTRLEPHQQEWVEGIQSCADSLLSLIDDILNFSKIESGAIQLEREPFNLCRCVEDSMGVCAQEAAVKGLELVCEFEDGLPEWILGDAVQLRQILVKLVGNAVKFTATGEVIVTVRRLVDARGALAEFVIRDSGIGIDLDRIPNLFQRFSQCDSSMTRRYGGTGLGLAICKRLAELMGGQIGVESVPGKGSAFAFTILAPEANAPQPVAELPSLEGVRVLIVDDNQASRTALKNRLGRWKMVAVEALSLIHI